jgi:hypothetical protein
MSADATAQDVGQVVNPMPLVFRTTEHLSKLGDGIHSGNIGETALAGDGAARPKPSPEAGGRKTSGIGLSIGLSGIQ